MRGALFVFVLCLFTRTHSQGIKRQIYPRMKRSCYRNMSTPALNECLKTNFQQSLPRFRSGIPGMYTGSIDPLYWPKFQNYFGGALIQGSLTVKDVSVRGFSNTKVLAVRANEKNPQKLFVDMDWRVPRMDFFGHFKLEGKIGKIQFHGAGPFTVNLTGVGGTWKVMGSRKKGEPYMEIVSFRGAPKIETFIAWTKRTAFGSEQLRDFILGTINHGWRIFHEIANPTVDRVWGNFCKENLNRVFTTVPYDELFPVEKPINSNSAANLVY